MNQSKQDVWKKFERWAKRYKNVCEKAINNMVNNGYYKFEDGLYLSFSKWYELNQDLLLDWGVSESELSNRISQKINFLRGYLIDISFDGHEFMTKKSDFFTLQYPSKCNHAIGIWLEQSMEGKVEAGSYFGFQEYDVNIFCKNVADIDLASMRRILPFDRMFLRLPKGKPWNALNISSVLRQVQEDIEFDYQIQAITYFVSNELLSINITLK
jgi:hypothetical protein